MKLSRCECSELVLQPFMFVSLSALCRCGFSPVISPFCSSFHDKVTALLKPHHLRPHTTTTTITTTIITTTIISIFFHQVMEKDLHGTLNS